ncbi:hypothetical protein [Methanobrevibacter sp.]|uniref:hypothetical protein n=1 Tax=Methanobrevibacter sp. TaxID=66852 RepID=UPI00386B39B3
MREFRTTVLLNSPLGKSIYLNGGILMSIQRKFWIGVLIYTIITWCLAFYIIWVTYN